ATGHPGVEIALPPGVVDRHETLQRRAPRPALELAAEHLVDALDHLDLEVVRRGDRLGRLPRAHRDRRVHRRHRIAAEPVAERLGLRPTLLVQREARGAGVEHVLGVGRRLPVPGQYEPQTAHAVPPERTSSSHFWAAANRSAAAPTIGSGDVAGAAVDPPLPARGYEPRNRTRSHLRYSAASASPIAGSAT